MGSASVKPRPEATGKPSAATPYPHHAKAPRPETTKSLLTLQSNPHDLPTPAPTRPPHLEELEFTEESTQLGEPSGSSGGHREDPAGGDNHGRQPEVDEASRKNQNPSGANSKGKKKMVSIYMPPRGSLHPGDSRHPMRVPSISDASTADQSTNGSSVGAIHNQSDPSTSTSPAPHRSTHHQHNPSAPITSRLLRNRFNRNTQSHDSVMTTASSQPKTNREQLHDVMSWIFQPNAPMSTPIAAVSQISTSSSSPSKKVSAIVTSKLSIRKSSTPVQPMRGRPDGVYDHEGSGARLHL